MRDYRLVLLVQMSAELLKDRLPEAREATRSIVLLIYSAVMEEEDESKEEEKQQEKWQKFC
ncbi:hypothetical protein Ccrd_006038 [Cynara cardunculus var. scolymus]|uniref:Armadillo-like helical n=1 Tax=Cynara cardunculus var. scolymus TaxID=59895 RepID=A0A103XJI9_CYNCS|nr:hypothetical protein Ccrd_006038 [Cynara cardunculus var. scolymus]